MKIFNTSSSRSSPHCEMNKQISCRFHSNVVVVECRYCVWSGKQVNFSFSPSSSEDVAQLFRSWPSYDWCELTQQIDPIKHRRTSLEAKSERRSKWLKLLFSLTQLLRLPIKLIHHKFITFLLLSPIGLRNRSNLVSIETERKNIQSFFLMQTFSANKILSSADLVT